MKRLFLIVSLTLLLCIGSTAVNAQTNNQGASNNKSVTMEKDNAKVAAILKAVELYAEAGRKASREIGMQAFTEGSFNDMFTLAEQNGEWKIVSKIYSVK